MEQFWGLLLALGSAAILYSSSGHGGATAYLALFGLWGLAPAQMKPLALLMNVVVAGTGAVRFLKAGAVPGRTVGLLLLGSVPCAFLGALVTLPAPTYRGLRDAFVWCGSNAVDGLAQQLQAADHQHDAEHPLQRNSSQAVRGEKRTDQATAEDDADDDDGRHRRGQLRQAVDVCLRQQPCHGVDHNEDRRRCRRLPGGFNP